MLLTAPAADSEYPTLAFLQQLQELGWSESRNVPTSARVNIVPKQMPLTGGQPLARGLDVDKAEGARIHSCAFGHAPNIKPVGLGLGAEVVRAGLRVELRASDVGAYVLPGAFLAIGLDELSY